MGWLSTLVGTLFIICLFPGCVVLGALWHNAGISLITPTMLLLLTLCNAPKLGTTVHCTAPKMGGIIEAITTLNGDTLPAPDSYKTLNNLNSVNKQSPKLKNQFFSKTRTVSGQPHRAHWVTWLWKSLEQMKLHWSGSEQKWGVSDQSDPSPREMSRGCKESWVGAFCLNVLKIFSVLRCTICLDLLRNKSQKNDCLKGGGNGI